MAVVDAAPRNGGGCYVVGITCQRTPTCPHLQSDELYPDDDDWISRGNTIIVAPLGHVLAGPLIGEPGILCTEIGALAREWRRFDVVVPPRPDVFHLDVNG